MLKCITFFAIILSILEYGVPREIDLEIGYGLGGRVEPYEDDCHFFKLYNAPMPCGVLEDGTELGWDGEACTDMESVKAKRPECA